MILTQQQIDEISALLNRPVVPNASLRSYSSFRIGGPADLLVEPESIHELRSVQGYANEHGIPYFILGAGTNVLFQDEGFRGIILRMGAIRGFEMLENGSDVARARIAAGEPLPAVVSRLAKLGWRGAEGLWGIPGMFGGAVATNAGSGGVWISDLLTEVKLMTPDGLETSVEKSDLQYGYRYFRLPRDTVVLEGTIRVNRDEPQSIEADIEAARSRRRRAQPIDMRTAGCVFKNPSADKPAGALIDMLVLKGHRVGDAQVSELHANFIVNHGNARAIDVLELIETIRSKVKEQEGIDLELEIQVVGSPRDTV